MGQTVLPRAGESGAQHERDLRSVLGALVCFGRAASFDEIRAVAGPCSEGVRGALATLEADGTITVEREPPPRYGFAKPDLADSHAKSMSATVSATLHVEIFRLLRLRKLRGIPVSACELARHALACSERPLEIRELLAAAAREAESERRHIDAARWYERLGAESQTENARIDAVAGCARATAFFDPGAAISMYSEALPLTREPQQRARLFAGRARAHRARGALGAALSDVEAAASLHGGLFEIVAQCKSLRHELASDAPLSARRAIENALELLLRAATQSGSAPDAGEVHATSVITLALAGRWNEALSIVKAHADTHVETGDLSTARTLLCEAARMHAWRGELRQARDAAARAGILADRFGEPAGISDAHAALGTVLLETGRATEARTALAGATRTQIDCLIVLAEACVATNDLLAAEDALARADAGGAPDLEAKMDRLRAEIAGARHAPDNALGFLESWIAREDAPAFEHARILELSARFLLQMDKATALDRAHASAHAYERMGAEPRRARLAEWIKTHTRPRGRPRCANLLTEREEEVIALVRQGLTDREIAGRLFLSLATVRKHVENAKRKLGVSRRIEIVTQWARD